MSYTYSGLFLAGLNMKNLVINSLFAFFSASCLLTTGCGSNTSLAEKGEKAFSEGDLEEASSLFQKASDNDPSSSALKYNAGVALAKLGDNKGAIAAFEGALSINPGDLDAAEYLAVELEKAGNYEDAHKEIEKVIAGHAGDNAALARALNTMAKIEIGLNRSDLALIRLFSARDYAPNYAPTYFNLAKLYGESYGLYKKAAAYIEAYLQIASIDAAERDTAEKLLQTYLQIPSRPQTPPDTPPSNADDPFQKGIASFSRQKYADAQQLFAKAEKLHPKSYYATLFHGHALYMQKKYKDAEFAYKTASIKATSEAEPRYWLGVIAYTADKNYSSALNIITGQAIPYGPEDFRYYQTVAEIYDTLGKIESQKNRNPEGYYYSSCVFAKRSIALAAAQRKSAPTAEGFVRAHANAGFKPTALP